jgi:hypothetical protein
MAKRSFEIRDIVEEFVARLSSLIEHDTVSRAREAVLGAFGGRAVAAGTGLRLVGGGAVRKRRKGPIQLCPVPGCKNRAAPVFGMVCADHKNLAKGTIKKYREQRRAKKVEAKARTTNGRRTRKAA